ncbi:hypothetical protein CAOG_04725 [Capsaspora owczarzaki ATCC 30864]|uniref:Uncharacterized protein n=1 Tax=Capsaspora owczarzaki (strain ATCC 30864) TaxID=595528 RepID=A0A0D2X3B6_CAPO3|nr:hypothetical protein CAOG_04725 [Capsaspora owczarzaki ATCC 30864]KJE94024.1 hypothetical protein CAOG_004725 [Capsaspora owczarzaki ATCC 30864]|eukprot:XP_004347472.1 hypothetical protein CAOG_04725 [Capsaspora owczarzaki ATCC 30864]
MFSLSSNARATSRLVSLARCISSPATASAAAAATAKSAAATVVAPPSTASKGAEGLVSTKDDSIVSTKMTVKDLFNVRFYQRGKDDAAFQELDRMCSQGTKTNLVSEFPLELAFEDIQKRGEGNIIECKTTGVLAATNRSYIHPVIVDGIERTLSYQFLLRVNPNFRNNSLGSYITGLAVKRDCKVYKADYFSAYVIETNVTSSGVQRKIEASNSLLADFETLGTYSSIAYQLRKDQPFQTPLDATTAAGVKIEHITDRAEQERIIRSSELINRQIFPADLTDLLASPLNLGLYVATDAAGRKAGALAWHSGRVRKTYVLNGDFQYDKSVLLHNPFTSAQTPEALALLHHLIYSLGNQFTAAGDFTSMFTFINKLNPITPALVARSSLHVEWLLKFWQSSGEKRTCDMSNGRSAWFDPRTCLI